MVRRSAFDLLILVGCNLLLAFLIWIPFYLQLNNFLGLNFSDGLNTIYRNFDGLEYVIIAKSFYRPEVITNLPQSLPAIYYSAHFPGFALVILLFASVFGFLKSMLFVSVIFTTLASFAFYFLVRDFRLTKNPLLLSLVFLIIPARWLIVHSVGSAEPMFIFFILAAIYLFLKFEATKQYQLLVGASILGALAQLTRPPGILFFIALFTYLIWKEISNKEPHLINRLSKMVINYLPILLIPLTLLGVFYWYSISYHDFFAYFHSGDNIHLTFPPFQVFNKNQFWVGDIWLEDIVYIFLLGFSGVVLLFKQKLYPLAFFSLIYLIASSLVSHRDISRYSLPVFPFILIAFEKFLTSREFKIVLAIVVLAIYLYAQNFLIANTAPIPNPQIFN